MHSRSSWLSTATSATSNSQNLWWMMISLRFFFLKCLSVSVLGWRHPGLQFPCGHTGSLHSQPGRGQRIQEAWNRYLHPVVHMYMYKHGFSLRFKKKRLVVKRSVIIKNLTIPFTFIPWVKIFNEMLISRPLYILPTTG